MVKATQYSSLVVNGPSHDVLVLQLGGWVVQDMRCQAAPEVHINIAFPSTGQAVVSETMLGRAIIQT